MPNRNAAQHAARAGERIRGVYPTFAPRARINDIVLAGAKKLLAS